ncbi:ornithine cyclodeaminase family protein [Aquimarina sp. AU474]|uniref:ornithine cyclodeaminase family protein n=1 Tax=Aquimarina sp. AU474 TaxID=2108529 RepID=UPI000D694CAC|nr:ornithine cyclodeaminase family protein [Aquimarina sp. AU474]
MVTIILKKEIEHIIKDIDLVATMEKGFIAYSNGNAIVPPVGELLFDAPKGETHIKYGYIKSEDYYVVKIASGFYENPKLGISSSQGLMLLFSQKTGQPISILLDEGYLTDIRTAAAGALVAKYFAPKNISSIGIIGTGIQAKLQLQYLQKYNPCKSVWVWGRTSESTTQFKSDLSDDFNIHIAKTPAQVAANSNLIVTTTPSPTPLLFSKDILPGTHITAVGSDTSEKQELDSDLLRKSDLLIADSIPQSKSRGEIYRAVKDNKVLPEKSIELGTAIQNKTLQRNNNNQITVADLTGVAVQDIMIAETVYTKFKNNIL